MEAVEILRQFQRNTGKFARAAVDAAVARREEITPELLRIFEETLDRAQERADDSDYMAHLYAMFLLAQFRETRAYPLFVRLASLPGELSHDLTGGFITQGLGQALASVCGGELAGIRSVVENEGCDQWARSAALSSLATLVAAGQKSRDEIVSYFARLFRTLARKPSFVWTALACESCDLHATELLGDIEQAFKDDLIDCSDIDFEYVQRDLARGREAALARLATDRGRRLIEDTVAEMGWWNCFAEDRQREREQQAWHPAAPVSKQVQAPFQPPFQPLFQPMVAPPPIQNTKPKTGRNDPCPCGSGKKYKRCCGA